MLLVVAAIAVVALVLACVAIVMDFINKSDKENDDANKRHTDNGNGQTVPKKYTPRVTEIKPVEVLQISSVNIPTFGNDAVADFAIDGNEGTYTHTDNATNPWWAADMGGIYQVNTVVITNQKGPSTRSLNLRVGVTNTKLVSGQNLALDAYTLCEQKPGLMGVVGIVSCPDGVTGQYLIVQFKTTNYMNIAEVNIYGYDTDKLENPSKEYMPAVTEIKPVDVFQINILRNKLQYFPGSAIDGNEGTYMHTNKATNPWWAADMGGIYHLNMVVITNGGSVLTRSTNLRVGVTNTKPVVGEDLALDAYTLCEEKPGYMGVVGIVSCPDEVTGQYLVVQFKITEYMHIAEVNIYGYEIEQ